MKLFNSCHGEFHLLSCLHSVWELCWCFGGVQRFAIRHRSPLQTPYLPGPRLCLYHSLWLHLVPPTLHRKVCQMQYYWATPPDIPEIMSISQLSLTIMCFGTLFIGIQLRLSCLCFVFDPLAHLLLPVQQRRRGQPRAFGRGCGSSWPRPVWLRTRGPAPGFTPTGGCCRRRGWMRRCRGKPCWCNSGPHRWVRHLPDRRKAFCVCKARISAFGHLETCGNLPVSLVNLTGLQSVWGCFCLHDSEQTWSQTNRDRDIDIEVWKQQYSSLAHECAVHLHDHSTALPWEGFRNMR